MPKNFYITSSLPYVNAQPHIGFAMEIIEADAIARYARQRGRAVRFQTGADEHGSKLAKTAAAAGKTPAELSAENAAKFRALREPLDLTFDDFIRTSDQQRHFPAAQKLWRKLHAAGKLEKRKYEGLYCSGCEEFKREKDLVDGLCENHKTAPEKVAEENWFFRLSDFSDEIVKLIETKKVEIVPDFRSHEFLNLAREGLHDISFSRPAKSLSWGIPVPDDDSQTMYVWCDALTNYISAIDFENEGAEFQKWWVESEKVHVIGKDIVRFHAGIWLGMLLAADLPLPQKIFVHGFITSEGQKISKSLGNAVDPVELSRLFGSDALRHFLLAEIPHGQDGDFSRARFAEVYNSQFADGLGNLISRTVTMALKIGETIAVGKQKTGSEKFAEKMWTGIEKNMQHYDLRGTILTIFELVKWTNNFISENKPWEIAKTKPEEYKELIIILLETIRQFTLALAPFLPKTAEKIAAILGIKLAGDFEKLKKWGAAKEFKLTKPEILFPKKDV